MPDQPFTFTLPFPQLVPSRVDNHIQRRLSNMRGAFLDQDVYAQMLAAEDSLVYEVYELKRPENAGELLLGISVVHPGRVGREFYMTKGHFHSVLETAEVYYVMKGEGFMVMETPEGDAAVEKLSAGQRALRPAALGAPLGVHRARGGPGDFLRLPRPRRPRLRHHRAAGFPQAGAGCRGRDRDRRQPALAKVRRRHEPDLKKCRVLVTPTSYGKNDPRLKSELEQLVGEVIYNPTGKPLTSAEVARLLPGVDGYIAGLDAIDRAALAAADRLKVIARYGVGFDNVDLEAAREKGILVTNTPGANSVSVAELALALMLCPGAADPRGGAGRPPGEVSRA